MTAQKKKKKKNPPFYNLLVATSLYSNENVSVFLQMFMLYPLMFFFWRTCGAQGEEEEEEKEKRPSQVGQKQRGGKTLYFLPSLLITTHAIIIIRELECLLCLFFFPSWENNFAVISQLNKSSPLSWMLIKKWRSFVLFPQKKLTSPKSFSNEAVIGGGGARGRGKKFFFFSKK